MKLFRSDNVLGIAEETLDFIIEICQDTHPNEFMGLLRTTDARKLGIDRDGRVITDVLIVPGTESGETMAVFHDEMLPTGTSSIGTVHSHPSGSLMPSDEDLSTFSRKGRYHIIVGEPYNRRSWKCYGRKGLEKELDVIDIELEDDDFFDFTEEDLI